MELSYRINDMLVESLCVRMRRQANKDDVVLGLCNRPPSQGEKVDEVFFLHGSLWITAFSVLLGAFSLSDICWNGHTAGGKQYRRILEDGRVNFFIQELNGPNE